MWRGKLISSMLTYVPSPPLNSNIKLVNNQTTKLQFGLGTGADGPVRSLRPQPVIHQAKQTEAAPVDCVDVGSFNGHGVLGIIINLFRGQLFM